MGERDLIAANSPSFEHVYVANQRCECGRAFRAVRQELRAGPSGPVDRIVAHCEGCGSERAFDFDIASFFGRFERYSRFGQTDDRFREAMVLLREGHLAEAEAALRQVVDPEEGEPAFAWAHYHLGMVLLAQSHWEEARVHLGRAAAIQPLEPEIQEGLARACRGMGRETEAQGHLERSAELCARFAADS